MKLMTKKGVPIKFRLGVRKNFYLIPLATILQ